MTQGQRRIQGSLFHEIRRIKAHIRRGRDKERHRTTLQDLPTELLEEIFAYACTDGGKTAYMLAQVSHHINATSRAARFHSLSLISGSPTQVRRVHQALKREREAAQAAGSTTPRVRHLCLTLTPLPERTLGRFNCRPLFIPGAQEHQETLRKHMKSRLGKEAWNAHGRKLAIEYYTEVEGFLAAVASHVETLLILGERPFLRRSGFMSHPGPRIGGLTIGEDGFPRLRELSFAGDQISFGRVVPGQSFKSSSSAGTTLPPLFPALERLNVTGFVQNRFKLVEWASQAPALRDVRITVNLYPPEPASPLLQRHLHWLLDNLRPSEARPDKPFIKIAIIRPEWVGDNLHIANYSTLVRGLRTHVENARNVQAAILWDYVAQDVRYFRPLSRWKPSYEEVDMQVLSNSLNGLLHDDWLSRMGHRSKCELEEQFWRKPQSFLGTGARPIGVTNF